MHKLANTTTLESEIKNISIKIYGNFKDTGIRFSAMHRAFKCGVKGLARYTEDDALYLEAEGRTEQIEHFKEWCLGIAEKYRKKKAEINYQSTKGYSDFSIID
ncbi:MAG: acylphosphatase [Bacteroidales bacterium]|nr:acylphosphatase [Bacteroidales bacterium]